MAEFPAKTRCEIQPEQTPFRRQTRNSVTGKTRNVLEQFGRDPPKHYPNCAPTAYKTRKNLEKLGKQSTQSGPIWSESGDPPIGSRPGGQSGGRCGTQSDRKRVSDVDDIRVVRTQARTCAVSDAVSDARCRGALSPRMHSRNQRRGEPICALSDLDHGCLCWRILTLRSRGASHASAPSPDAQDSRFICGAGPRERAVPPRDTFTFVNTCAQTGVNTGPGVSRRGGRGGHPHRRRVAP